MAVRRGTSAAGGFLADFRDFIMRGNVIDLAVAVILGAAFNQIIQSLVEDIITPALLQPALDAAGVDQLSELSANGIRYGLFLAAVINFLVVAFVIFLLIRAFERAKRQFVREEEVVEEVDPVLESQERLTGAMDRLTAAIERRTP
ncbi:large conductance mechanosensitive channel protein MscL [Egbenema bharatensis]|uniref:large conductance mechanosensitive channel protein MscL n=1 Tax=Egbenema bharatensis TaxID=3463334 RepID=UPI003A836A93